MDVEYYSIHDIIKVKTNVKLPILPDYFKVKDELTTPDIEVLVGELKIDLPEDKKRCGIFFLQGRGSSLFIDYKIPFLDAKLIIDDLEGKTKIKFTKALKKFGKVEVLFNTILLLKFIQKGYALVHSGCVNSFGNCYLISAMRDMGKTSTVLSLLDGNKFKFMSDDLTILRDDGKAFSYPTKVGISPFTLTGNMVSYTGGRMKKLIAKSQLLIFILENFLKFELSERKEIPHELIEDEGTIEKVFILAGSREKEGIRKIDNSEAARKILMTTAELLDPFRVYSLNYYSYIFDLDTLKLFNKEKEIIEKAIADAECFELRANKVERYVEMVKEVI